MNIKFRFIYATSLKDYFSQRTRRALPYPETEAATLAPLLLEKWQIKQLKNYPFTKTWLMLLVKKQNPRSRERG